MRVQLFSFIFLLLCVPLFFSSCTQGLTTVYWSKAGADRAALQRDKEECQTLQRSVGANESRIHKCLEAKGWTQVQEMP